MFTKKVLIGCLSIFLWGCQINTVNLEPNFQLSGKRENKSIVKNLCPVHLAQYSDVRKSKSLGIVSLSIVETDVESWVYSALDHYNIKQNNDTNNTHIKIELVKAYVQSMASSMAANVVFSAQYREPESTSFSNKKFFRGYEVDVNWNSGEDEILTTMNKAIANSLRKVRHEIGLKCES